MKEVMKSVLPTGWPVKVTSPRGELGIRGKKVEGLAEVGGVRWREQREGEEVPVMEQVRSLVLEKLMWIATGPWGPPTRRRRNSEIV
jgi:hypothetical protein